MRLYYLEMKRLIRTKSVWILMIAMVVLAAVMAYVPVTFIRAYKTDAGNVQAVTGVQAVKISKETRKDMEGEVTEEKIRQAIRVLNEMYQEYGSSFMEEVPADVYAEKIYPIMPVLNVIEQVLVPDGKNLYNMEAFDVKEEDAATIYEKYREEIQGLSQNPELVKEMQKISGSVKTPFTYESGMTLETVDYYTIYLFLVMFAFIVIASPVYAAEYPIANVLAEHLRTWDYEVHCVTNFKNVMEDFREYEPQLVLLDIVLPLFNGFHWCQEIRKISKVPIIFLSSANDNMNIVMAMNMGGDEFVEKPFDLSVVTAKVQAVLRRAYAFRGTMDVLEHAGVMLNVNDATVTCGSQSVELTKNEFRILKLLMENSGRIVSRENLITRLWESDEFIDDNTLTVNVARLRKKLEEIGAENWIQTKKGIGYIVE